MAKADWESEDFEPKVFQKPLLNSDRWEGEDEDDDVKDNWDDDEEEREREKTQQEGGAVAVQPKKKKSLAQILAEKEEKRRKELEEKMKKAEEEEKIATPEEIFSEKLRQQKLQEEADLELAKETFGVTTDSVSGIDNMNPSTREDFESFRKELVNKITKYDSSPHYLLFLEDLCRDLCLSLQHEDIKKITSNLNALATEKLKAQKQAVKPKKRSKKATLNIGKENFAIIDYGDEYEDCI